MVLSLPPKAMGVPALPCVIAESRPGLEKLKHWKICKLSMCIYQNTG